jgi:glutathione S-transferase
MEQRLAHHDYIATDTFSIADIALYAYTHAAPLGGIALDPYPAVRAWLARVAALPGHIALEV